MFYCYSLRHARFVYAMSNKILRIQRGRVRKKGFLVGKQKKIFFFWCRCSTQLRANVSAVWSVQCQLKAMLIVQKKIWQQFIFACKEHPVTMTCTRAQQSLKKIIRFMRNETVLSPLSLSVSMNFYFLEKKEEKFVLVQNGTQEKYQEFATHVHSFRDSCMVQFSTENTS